MSFWRFLRDMFVFDWLFRNHSKNGTPTKHTDNYTTYDSDSDCDHDYEPPCSSGCSHISWDDSWDDRHYASDDYYHDSADDWAHDEDDFEDDN